MKTILATIGVAALTAGTFAVGFIAGGVFTLQNMDQIKEKAK